MKILLLSFLVLLYMIPLEIHDYINKPVSEFPYDLKETESYTPNKKSYVTQGYFLFFGTSYDYIRIDTDLNDFIVKISFNIRGVFDKSYYQKLVNEYGTPYKMIKEDKVIYQGEPSSTINGITSRETQFTVKECTFEENPFKIVWNKENYSIELLLKQSEKLTFKSIYVEIKNNNID